MASPIPPLQEGMDCYRAPKTLPGGVLGYVVKFQANILSEPQVITLPGEPTWFPTASALEKACLRHGLSVHATAGVHKAPIRPAERATKQPLQEATVR